eukprot:992905-Amphidinium_carterae.1
MNITAKPISGASFLHWRGGYAWTIPRRLPACILKSHPETECQANPPLAVSLSQHQNHDTALLCLKGKTRSDRNRTQTDSNKIQQCISNKLSNQSDEAFYRIQGCSLLCLCVPVLTTTAPSSRYYKVSSSQKELKDKKTGQRGGRS